MYEIAKLVRCKNREKYALKKNNHTQDSIYVVRQFAYAYGIAGISLFSGKIQNTAIQFSFLKTNIKP